MSLSLSPHGHLLFEREAGEVLPERLEAAFARNSGHGLLWLGAGETGALPSVLAWWREFGGKYRRNGVPPDGKRARSFGGAGTGS